MKTKYVKVISASTMIVCGNEREGKKINFILYCPRTHSVNREQPHVVRWIFSQPHKIY